MYIMVPAGPFVQIDVIVYYCYSFLLEKGKLADGHRPQVLKLFTAVIYEFLLQVRVYVPGKPFQRSLMFEGKAGSLSL